MKLVEAGWTKHMDEIDEIIKRTIEEHMSTHVTMTFRVADAVMREIDPDKASSPAWEGAHAYVRERTAGMLRKMFDPELTPEEAL